MASEATIMAIPDNMHIDARVNRVALIKSEVKFDLRFDSSNPNYPGIYVHIAWNSHYGGL